MSCLDAWTFRFGFDIELHKLCKPTRFAATSLLSQADNSLVQNLILLVLALTMNQQATASQQVSLS